jgi:hypothetical protein
MHRTKVPFLFLFAALHLLILNDLYAQAPKLVKTIIVDAGHGGKDVGATGQYENSLLSKEKDVTPLEIRGIRVVSAAAPDGYWQG